MFDRTKPIHRTQVGQAADGVMDLPDLVDIQLSSYERFLQRETMLAGNPPLVQGLTIPSTRIT
jgi:DNA-directed RNA polymerase subunit beta